MKKKMRLAGIVMLAVTLIVVGVLVWPQPKPAMATVTYYITLYITMDEMPPFTWEYLGDTQVRFVLDDVPYDRWTNETAGIAWQNIPNWAQEDWTASMEDDDWVVCDPATGEQIANQVTLNPVVNSHTFYLHPPWDR